MRKNNTMKVKSSIVLSHSPNFFEKMKSPPIIAITLKRGPLFEPKRFKFILVCAMTSNDLCYFFLSHMHMGFPKNTYVKVEYKKKQKQATTRCMPMFFSNCIIIILFFILLYFYDTQQQQQQYTSSIFFVGQKK